MRRKLDHKNYNSNPLTSNEYINLDFTPSYKSPMDSSKKQSNQLILKIAPRDISPARYVSSYHSARPSLVPNNQDAPTPQERSKSPNAYQVKRASTSAIKSRIDLLKKIEQNNPEEFKKVLNQNFPTEGESIPIGLPNKSNLMKRPGPYFLAQKMEEAKIAKNAICRINAKRIQHHERGSSQTLSKTTATEESMHDAAPLPPYHNNSMQKLLRKFPVEPKVPYTDIPKKGKESPDNSKVRSRIKQQILAEVAAQQRLSEHISPSPPLKATTIEPSSNKSHDSPPLRPYMFKKSNPRALTSRRERGVKSFSRLHVQYDSHSILNDQQSRLNTLQDDTQSQSYSKFITETVITTQNRTPLFKNQVLAKAIIEFKPSEDQTFKSPRISRDVYTRNSFMRAHLKVSQSSKGFKHIRAESSDHNNQTGDLDDESELRID